MNPPAKHTPGPWRVDDLSNIGKGAVICPDETRFWTDDGFEYAHMRIEDARLIAAAPDLLVALKELMAPADPNATTAEIDAMSARANAAIAKAEGRS